MKRPFIDRYYVRRQQADSKRQPVWQAMRVLRDFTTADIAAVCEIDKPDSVRSYCNFLVRAGFLRRRGRGGWHPSRYTLVRNSGPEPPAMVRNGKSVWDPNTGTEYPL